MKNQDIGYVVVANDEVTKIKLGRHSDCKSCGACAGSNSVILTVNNPVGAKVGDKVYVEMPKDKVISSIYVVYVQPLLLTFLGVVIAYFISPYIHANEKVLEVVFGVIFFSISIIIIRAVDQKASQKKNNLPTITNIIYEISMNK